MSRSSRWNVSSATVIQLASEAAWVLLAVQCALFLNGRAALPRLSLLIPALVFAILTVLVLGMFGTYRRDRKTTLTAYATRLVFAMVIALPLAYFTADVLPGGRPFQDTIAQLGVLAFAGMVVVRQLVTGPFLRYVAPHRVLVLGTGPEARLVEAAMATANEPGVRLVGFYALEKVGENVVSPTRIVSRRGTIDETVKRLGVHEIIVAVREQRGGVLPLRGLLDCRLAGVRVTDLARFFEHVHGQIAIDSLKASWLIYGNGFRQGWLRTAVKRVFDVVCSLAVLIAMLPVVVLVALAIVVESGFPIIYRQERVGLRGKTFNVLKFRSMRQDAEKDGKARWAAAGDDRVTRIGRLIRRTRIDELPQVLNVLRGEMSFVGPRPERPVFVEMLTEKIPFYAVRHSVKPGLTGWAQVRYSYGASVEQATKKLEYDLYYVKNHTLFLDLMILIETVRVVLLGEGVR
jgi:sugar transferase (PEP-CTERM system associated)